MGCDASTGDANNMNAQMINSFFMGNALDGDYDEMTQKLKGMGFPEFNTLWAAKTLALDRNQSRKIPDALFLFGNQMKEAYDNSTKELVAMGFNENLVHWAGRILMGRDRDAMGVLANFWNAFTTQGVRSEVVKHRLLAGVMVEKRDEIELCVLQALEDIKDFNKDNYNQITADKRFFENIQHVMRTQAAEYFWIAEELADKPKEDHAEALKKLLPPIRILEIENSLNIPTFKVRIVKDESGSSASFTRDGETFLKTIRLDSEEAILDASWTQWASITLEAIMLTMACVGIHAQLDQAETASITAHLADEIASSSALQKATKEFESKWRTATSKYDEALAIFHFLKSCNSAGILKKTGEAIIDKMSWWQRAKAIALLTTQIVVALGSDGAALIGEIVLALSTAYEFGKKMINIAELNEMRTLVESKENEI